MTKARDLANSAAAFSAVSATELGYVDGVTSAIQTQLDAKAASSTAVTLTGTQTLTNKTLTSPALTTPTISTLTTNGDVLYGTGSGALSRLGIGSTGNVLTVASGLPSWSAPAGGGKVLQVVQSTYATQVSNNTTTYADTGLTVSITPTLATSKVLIMAYLNMEKNSAAGDNGIYLKLVRASTDILTTYILGYTATAIRLIFPFATHYLDSPNTTSSTAYKFQFANFINSSAAIANDGGSTSVIIAMEIGA